MYNNPVKYIDPSGHSVDCALGEENCEAGEYVDPPTDELPPGDNVDEELTTVQRIGKGLTYLVVMVAIVVPAEGSLILASIAATSLGPEGLVVDAILLPAEIVIADFAISYGIKTYKEIESGQNVEFTWTILPAVPSTLPEPIQEGIHSILPGIFP